MNSDHTGEVCQDSDLLFMDGVQGFWSGHSDRPTLTSWASILGHPGEHIEMIGRWSPSSSEEYIRTAKTTVLRLQASVAKAIREAGQEDILGEAALADQLDAYLTERGIPSELIFRTAYFVDGLASDKCVTRGRMRPRYAGGDSDRRATRRSRH